MYLQNHPLKRLPAEGFGLARFELARKNGNIEWRVRGDKNALLDTRLKR